jgi:hypothetical protein
MRSAWHVLSSEVTPAPGVSGSSESGIGVSGVSGGLRRDRHDHGRFPRLVHIHLSKAVVAETKVAWLIVN